MTDSKTPPRSDNTDSDKDFDGSPLPDTDRDFFAELDWLLTDESKGQLPTFFAQEGNAAPKSIHRTSSPPQREHRPSYWLWSAAALLGLLGIAAGGIGLWQASTLSAQLVKVESMLLSIADFKQRMQREQAQIGADLETLRSSMEAKLATQSEQLHSSKEELETSLTELRAKLQTMQPGQHDLSPTAGATGKETSTVDADKVTAAETNAIQPETETANVMAESVASEELAPSSAAESRWAVNLIAFKNKDNAEQAAERLRSNSVPVQIKTFTSKGTTWHRLVVNEFRGYEAAKAFADKTRSRVGSSWPGAWVSRH